MRHESGVCSLHPGQGFLSTATQLLCVPRRNDQHQEFEKGSAVCNMQQTHRDESNCLAVLNQRMQQNYMRNLHACSINDKILAPNIRECSSCSPFSSSLFIR
jgi:hypothetical protein